MRNSSLSNININIKVITIAEQEVKMRLPSMLKKYNPPAIAINDKAEIIIATMPFTFFL